MDFNLLWFIPISPPISEFSDEIMMKILGVHLVVSIMDIIIKGPSFCQVDRIRQFIHEMDAMTEGNQKWHGAMPSFRKRAANRMYAGSGADLLSHRDDDAMRIRLLPRA